MTTKLRASTFKVLTNDEWNQFQTVIRNQERIQRESIKNQDALVKRLLKKGY